LNATSSQTAGILFRRSLLDEEPARFKKKKSVVPKEEIHIPHTCQEHAEYQTVENVVGGTDKAVKEEKDFLESDDESENL